LVIKITSEQIREGAAFHEAGRAAIAAIMTQRIMFWDLEEA
jgi:hypothetical protein